MSRANLEDTIAYLTKSSSNSPLLPTLQSYLSKHSSDPIEYVSRLGNEINQFEYASSSFSNNHLINAIQSETSYPVYKGKRLICEVWSRVILYFNQ